MSQDGRIKPPLDPDRHWSAKGSDLYDDVAARLLGWAAGASSSEVRTQLTLLAALYEQLARKSEQLADTYLPTNLDAELP